MPLPARYAHIVSLRVTSHIPLKGLELQKFVREAVERAVKDASVESPKRDFGVAAVAVDTLNLVVKPQ